MWTEEGTKAGQQSMETPRTDQLGLLLILSRREEDSSRTETGGGDAMQKVAGGCVDPLPPCAPPGGILATNYQPYCTKSKKQKEHSQKREEERKPCRLVAHTVTVAWKAGGKLEKSGKELFCVFFSFLLFGMRENWEGKRRKKIKTASDSYPRKEGRKRRNQWAR